MCIGKSFTVATVQPPPDQTRDTRSWCKVQYDETVRNFPFQFKFLGNPIAVQRNVQLTCSIQFTLSLFRLESVWFMVSYILIKTAFAQNTCGLDGIYNLLSCKSAVGKFMIERNIEFGISNIFTVRTEAESLEVISRDTLTFKHLIICLILNLNYELGLAKK